MGFGGCVVVYMPVLRALDTFPDPLDLHRCNPVRYPYLLESVVQGTANARYSLVFAFPGEQLVLSPEGWSGDFLQALDTLWARERLPPESVPVVPFRGGWFVYLGYELAGQIEPSLRLPLAPKGLPTAFATRISAALILDHQAQQAWLMAEEGHEGLLDLIAADIADLTPMAVTMADGDCTNALSEDEPREFLTAVRRIKAYIREGDVFQVNLSRAWRGQVAAKTTAADLYWRLRRQNPAPFAGLAQWGENAIISSSPERLVRLRNRVVETRPIAGTRPRGTVHAADLAYASELLAHPKERAEHVMLIDLERNDLGRVCRLGTVTVDELMVLESYAHVHHIVSNIRGELRDDITPGEVIRAVFPGGTITGCPKVRCMEIIAELEGTGRGPYTGAMGYLNRDGDLDFNILIRTLVKNGPRVAFRAGGGIVADSVPERELEETRAKARGLLLALAGGS
jgi:anthranilate synthase component 1